MTHPDYGIDAPGIVSKMLVAGTCALLLFLLAVFGFWQYRPWGVLIAAPPLLCAVYFFGMYCLLLHSSRIGKLAERDHLLDLISWSGRERVLDVGCGRGLMLVGVAKRLRGGKAVGVDLWRTEDQADNSPEATLNNAVLEGVAERIDVQTADMRQLPFPDGSFDVVVSHWAVHNLSNVEERAKALTEIIRVLRPAGYVVLADISHKAEYTARFVQLGLTDIRHVGDSWQAAFLAATSFGGFRPTAIIARKAAAAPSK